MRISKSRLTVFLAMACWVLSLLDRPVEASSNDLVLSAEQAGSRVIVRVGDDEFTQYKFDSAQKYPYFWPINGPRSGRSVTTESSQPWPHHHSLFFGCDKVNGGNYWQDANDRGQIRSMGVKVLQAKGKSVVIRDHCRWERPDHPAVFDDLRVYTITAPSVDLRWIEVDVTLTALVNVHVPKTNHSLFSVRVSKDLSVAGGGTLINANNQRAEAGTFGQRAIWCDMSGTLGDEVEGIAVLVHPENAWSPCRWFTRDYGFMSPTPMYWLDDAGWRLPRGKSIRLRYLVVIHAGDAEAAHLSGVFNHWAGR